MGEGAGIKIGGASGIPQSSPFLDGAGGLGFRHVLLTAVASTGGDKQKHTDGKRVHAGHGRTNPIIRGAGTRP